MRVPGLRGSDLEDQRTAAAMLPLRPAGARHRRVSLRAAQGLTVDEFAFALFVVLMAMVALMSFALLYPEDW